MPLPAWKAEARVDATCVSFPPSQAFLGVLRDRLLCFRAVGESNGCRVQRAGCDLPLQP